MVKSVKDLPFSIAQKISKKDSIVWLKASNRYIILKLLTIIQLFNDNKHREHALNKISIHYNNKTLLNYLYTWLKM